jgi:hypothetical protein
MERLDQYPTVPYAAFVDSIGPAVTSDFLNRGQRGFQDILGALWGRSATLLTDEFNQRTYPAGTIGSFEIVAPTANITTAPALPTAINQHGIWHVFATATAAAQFIALDAPSWLGTLDFAFSEMVSIDKRSDLETLLNGGFQIGIYDQAAPSSAQFAAGNDSPNWQLYINAATLIDTGIPVVDGVWYSLQACRIAGTIYAFINGTLVVTNAFPADMTSVVREMIMNSSALTINNGFYVDYHRTWYQR